MATNNISDYRDLSREDLSDPTIFEQYPTLKRLATVAAELEAQHSGRSAGDIYNEIRRGERTDLLHQVILKERGRRPLDPSTLVGEHHGFTVTLETYQHRTEHGPETRERFVVSGTYVQPMAERLGNMHGEWDAKRKEWRVPATEAKRLRAAINKLPEMIKLQSELDAQEERFIGKLLGRHHGEMVVERDERKERCLVIVLRDASIRTIAERLGAIGATYESGPYTRGGKTWHTLPRWVIGFSKADDLLSIINAIPTLVLQEQKRRTERSEQEATEKARQQEIAAARAEEKRRRETRAFEADQERGGMRDQADAAIGRLHRTVCNGSSAADVMEAAYYQYGDGNVVQLADGGLYVREAIGKPYRDASDEWSVSVTMIRATPEQIEIFEEEVRQQEKRRNAEDVVKRLQEIWVEKGERPEPAQPEGELILDRSNAGGTGTYWRIGPEWIWYVMQHGADGDSWGVNNAPGAVAWRMKADESTAACLRELDAIIIKR